MRLFDNDDGQAMVEYALLFGLIAAAVVFAAIGTGDSLLGSWSASAVKIVTALTVGD